MLRLSKHNKRFLKVILDGFFRIYLASFFKKLKPKKYKAYGKYAIVSAVYNVEKYLDDFFQSIITQRLDFKNNILLILVDDGSTDNSAQIIKKYQNKFPQNIIYLHKENGGQASARNLGLRYLKENSCDVSWVSFVDPDDFLDRDYFYEVDSFLARNKNENIAMLACHLIFYFENKKLYKDDHPLNFKFQKDKILQNKNLEHFIQLACNSAFLNVEKLFQSQVKFDEGLKPNFEDAKFINEYLLENFTSKTAFLKHARYFYRKRSDKSSTLDNKKEAELKQVLKMGYLLLLLLLAKDKFGKIPNFIQNTIIYDTFWTIRDGLDNETKFKELSSEEKQEILRLFDAIYELIDEKNIYDFKLCNIKEIEKKGILHCFKKAQNLDNQAFIESIDEKKDEILLVFYTSNLDERVEFLFDKMPAVRTAKKTLSHFYLDRHFIYEQRFWVRLPQDAREFEVLSRAKKCKIYFDDKELMDLNLLYQALQKQKQERAKNSKLWLFADRAFYADDNAEHFYRYVMREYPKQNIAFILQKSSPDFKRLKKQGFRLIDPRTLKFKFAIHKADKIISSHIDKYIFNALGGDTLTNKDFIFLQHGVTQNDVSKWLNQKKIDLFITSTKAEFHSIVDNLTPYKFSTKEVKLTGFARHDSLFLNNQTHTKQILIMPTWRAYLVGAYSLFGFSKAIDISQSLYFRAWQEFLQNTNLKELCEKYHYTLVFNLHPNMKKYLNQFSIPSHIQLWNKNLQDAFYSSCMMITDYSSVAFEMAYLKKPVLYYHFDKEEFFAKHTTQKGYFNYESDGFGAVCENEEKLLKELEILLQNDCKTKEPYKSNIENTFEFRDNKNCERIYKEIQKLSSRFLNE